MPCCRSNKVQPFKEEPETLSPEEVKRSCTDIVCLFLFVVCLGGMGYVAYISMATGDPYRLIFGMDSWGNVCGKQNKEIQIESIPVPLSGQDMTQNKNLFYYKSKELASMIPAIASTRVCVSQCPNQTLMLLENIREYEAKHEVKLCHYDKSPSEYSSDVCPDLPVTPHKSILNRCHPEAAVEAGSHLLKTVTSSLNLIPSQCPGGDFLQKITGDIERSWLQIAYLCAIAFGVALTVTILMRFFAAPMIWSLIILSSLGSLGATGISWWEWYKIKQEVGSKTDLTQDDLDSQRNWLIIACIISAVSVIILLILLVMRKRIALVIQLFREAGLAIGKMPALLFQPIWTLIFLAGSVAGLGFLFMYIETAGVLTLDSDTGWISYLQPDPAWPYLIQKWFFVFGVLWIVQFIFACQQLVIAGAVGIWYFASDKSNLGSPVMKSLQNLIRYHLGSVALGALLIALIQFCRIVLAYFQRQLAGRTSSAAQFVMKCLQCCLWCFEKFLKFLNRNAYIMVAICGYNFCKGAKRAFSLLLSNVLRVGAINSVGVFCLFLGKVGVVAVVAVVGLEAFKFKEREDLCYYWLPILIASVFAYLISHCFLSVYGMTIDTVFLCFCEDCEQNDGITKPYYMSKKLMKFVEESKKIQVAEETRNMKHQPHIPFGQLHHTGKSKVDW